jgi:hypothetical protein
MTVGGFGMVEFTVTPVVFTIEFVGDIETTFDLIKLVLNGFAMFMF